MRTSGVVTLVWAVIATSLFAGALDYITHRAVCVPCAWAIMAVVFGGLFHREARTENDKAVILGVTVGMTGLFVLMAVIRWGGPLAE